MPIPIANWEDANAYPDPNETTPKRWAFEFLRRNHAYQRDFKEYLSICDTIVPGFNPYMISGDDGEHREKLLRLHDDERHQAYDPPRLKGETEHAWVTRVGRGITRPLSGWYAAKWGLRNHLFDPHAAYDFFFVDFSDQISAVVAGPGWEGFKHVQAPYHSEAFVIDYRKPLWPQIEAIKRRAKNHQGWLEKQGHIEPRQERRARPGILLRQYLRCLDATDAGKSPAEIADVLSEKDPAGFDAGHIAKQIEAAEELRGGGYRFLLIPGK